MRLAIKKSKFYLRPVLKNCDNSIPLYPKLITVFSIRGDACECKTRV